MRSKNRSCSFILVSTLLLIASQFPVFVQQTLTPDTVLYDLQAQCLLNGGVLYRDILEPNLPGIVWIHAIVRTLIGWSSQALHVFDLFIVLVIGALLARLARIGVRRCERTPALLLLTMPGVLLFYFGTSEWCHCQRDTWMLLPCLAAVMIRTHALRKSSVITDRLPLFTKQQFYLGVVEGVCWAVGFWLKPFVGIPAVLVMLVSLRYSPSFRVWRWHTFSVLLGGLLSGLMGIAWMMSSGCWPFFVDQLTQWNGDYFHAGRSRWTLERFLAHAIRFQPWVCLHCVALWVTGRQLFTVLLRSASAKSDEYSLVSALLSAMYVGWILQAFFLQQLFDYVHVPGVLLAWTICVRHIAVSMTSAGTSAAWRGLALPAMAAFFCLALIYSPIVRWERQRLWFACVQACFGTPLTAQARDQIAQIPFPRWRELQPMIDHLREEKIAGDSVLAYNGNLIHLYPALKIQPATRYVYLDVLARSFAGRRNEMIAALERSNVRFVVSDLREDGFEAELSAGQLAPAMLNDVQSPMCFPYNQTPIFRSGGYLLFRIDRPIDCLSNEYLPLATPHGQHSRTIAIESASNGPVQ